MLPPHARAVLPINYSGDRREVLPSGQQVVQPAGFKFSELTLSNLARGSGLYWVHFVFVYCFTLWVMWLLIKYYQARCVLPALWLGPALAAFPVCLLLHVLGDVAACISSKVFRWGKGVSTTRRAGLLAIACGTALSCKTTFSGLR